MKFLRFFSAFIALFLFAAMGPGSATCFASDVTVNIQPLFLDNPDPVNPQYILKLVIEGPEVSVSDITLTSSNTNVIDSPAVSSLISDVPCDNGHRYSYRVDGIVKKIGLATVTTTVTIGDNTYSGSQFLIVHGVSIIGPKTIILDEGDSCMLFAERYLYEYDQLNTDLEWTAIDNYSYFHPIVHISAGSSRKKESATVTAGSLEADYYGVKHSRDCVVRVTHQNTNTLECSDQVSIRVVPKRTLTIKRNLNDEITGQIELSNIGDTAGLQAYGDGFNCDNYTWESSDPEIVSISSPSADRVSIKREKYSDSVVAITAAAEGEGIRRKKTVYIAPAPSEDPSLRITCNKDVSSGSITIKEGETLTLSSLASPGLEPTATVWSAVTDSGRVPVKLNSTVGKSITITGRVCTDSDPVAITAVNGGGTDTVYVNVLPGVEKSIKITGPALGADGVIALSPGDTAELNLESKGFNGPAAQWEAGIAANSENPRGTGACPVTLSSVNGSSTTVTAVSKSVNFSKVSVQITEGNEIYSDEIFVKTTGCDIIKSAGYLELFKGDTVTLRTLNGENARWTTESNKTPLGDLTGSPTTVNGSSVSVNCGDSQTLNPSLIKAVQSADNDSVYISVKNGRRQIVSFDLNGGYGTVPDPVIISPDDTIKSIILRRPAAIYPAAIHPDDDIDYVFGGWSEFPDAGSVRHSVAPPIFFPGQLYAPASGSDVTLYAIWIKRSEDALFEIVRDAGCDPRFDNNYLSSGIYIEDALNPEAFNNTKDLESRLAKVPSDDDITRVMNLQYSHDDFNWRGYDPDHDRVVWFEIGHSLIDDPDLPEWRVIGAIVSENWRILTYDPNLNSANITGMPSAPWYGFPVGDSEVIPTDVPSCTGATFAGWNTKRDGSGQWYSSTGRYSYNGTEGDAERLILLTEDTTLYAMWNVEDPNLDRSYYAPDVNLVYDGKAHGIKANLYNTLGSADVKYGEREGEYTLDESPAITKVSESGKVVYYRITAKDGVTYTGSASISIAKAPLTVTAGDNRIIYGDTPSFNGVKFNGFVNNETEDTEGVLAGTLSLNCGYSRYGNAGSYLITPGGLRADNYNISFIPGTLTVDRKAVTVKADDRKKKEGESDPALTATVTGLIGEEKIAYTLAREKGEAAGTYKITPSGNEIQGNYRVTFNNGTFTIIKKGSSQEPSGSGTDSDDSGTSTDEPDGKSDDPNSKSDDPGGKSDDPNSKSDDPGGKSDDPNSKSDDPGGKSDDPNSKSDDPDVKPDNKDPGTDDPNIIPDAGNKGTASDIKNANWIEVNRGDFRIGYCPDITFWGKAKADIKLFGERGITVTSGGVSYKAAKIKVNKKKCLIRITGLESAPKDIVKSVKKATKGKNGLSFTINPYYVKAADKVITKQKKDGSLRSVKVNINGKDYKAKKTEYEYDSTLKLITFKGENLAGSYTAK